MGLAQELKEQQYSKYDFGMSWNYFKQILVVRREGNLLQTQRLENV